MRGKRLAAVQSPPWATKSFLPVTLRTFSPRRMYAKIRKMHLTDEQVAGLARTARCPRCDHTKTIGTGLCRSCRTQLPEHMRRAVEGIHGKKGSVVGRALRAAAQYLNVHFQSVRNFGGGKKR